MSGAPRIVYIVAAGHSGSTLLDQLIGSHGRFESLGELKALTRARGPERARLLAEPCPCGAPRKRDCRFWKEVDERLHASLGRGLDAIDVADPDPARFVEDNRALFQAAARASGRAWLVDSSKSVRRLRCLADSGAFDLHPVLLSRDARGVVYSNLRKGRHFASATARHLRQRVGLRGLRDLRHAALRYEDLARDPEQQLRRLMAWLGEPFESAQLDGTHRSHHLLGGNRMRFDAHPEIRPDEAWRTGLSGPQRALLAAVDRMLPTTTR